MTLRGALRDRVLRRLGFPEAPSPDFEGLRAIYRAWGERVPFDNVRKMIALRSAPELPLPGGHAVDFFESWLRDGPGGTCWPTSNALYELLQSLGFQARRITGSMYDLGIVNHASVKVSLGDRNWLVDSSLLCEAPLPLNGTVFVLGDPVFEAEVEFDGRNHLVWSHLPPNSSFLPCRLFEDSATQPGYLAWYEESRNRSPFNQRLYARRNHPQEIVVILGNTRFSKTADRVASCDLSPDELCQALRDDIALSERIIREWTRVGGLAASFESHSGAKPPPVTRKPPSQRTVPCAPGSRA